jgi:hypothetical protein
MEEADNRGDVKTVHKLAGTLQGKWKRGVTTITKDETGTPLCKESDRLAVFKRFFEVKFGPAPAVLQTITPKPIEIPPDREPPPTMEESLPTLEEVKKAVSSLSNEKSPGVDEIPIELFKHSPEALDELHKLICQIWEEESFPEDWTQGLFVNIYKNKGNKNDPANYRPICLLCHAYKVFAIIILERIRHTADARIKEGQEGFRNGRGCRDNLHVLRAAINYALKNSIKAELIFIDFTQAFDTVSHDFLQIALEEHAIPLKYRTLIGVIYANAKGRIKGSKGATSDLFPIRRGVLQGCILSPILFVICLNSIWARESPNKGWQITPEWLLDELSYADDIALINNEGEDSQGRLQEFSDRANQTATLHINIIKTVKMTVAKKITVEKTTQADIQERTDIFKFACDACGRAFDNLRGVTAHKKYCLGEGNADAKPRRNQRANKIIETEKRNAKVAALSKIKLNGEDISNVDVFRYLGAKITSYGTDIDELEVRTNQAIQIHRALKGFWSDRRLDLPIKVRLFKVRVLSALTYGAESWKMTKQMVQKLRGFAVKCFSSMTHTPRSEDQPSYRNRAVIKARFNVAISHIDIITMIDKRRWQWLGHALRMKPHRNPHKALALLDTTPGSLLFHLPETHRQLTQAIQLASDRMSWKSIYENSEGFVSLSMLCPTG